MALHYSQTIMTVIAPLHNDGNAKRIEPADAGGTHCPLLNRDTAVVFAQAIPGD